MFNKVKLLLNTIKYLKPIQIFYQVKYRTFQVGPLSKYDKLYSTGQLVYLSFKKSPPVLNSYISNGEFEFLNLKHKFESEIDWNYLEYGKLWNYNLQYCNFLFQNNFSVDIKKDILVSLYRWLDEGKLALEPYPASLRIINVIRLCSLERVSFQEFIPFLHAELDFISKRPEFHILGNHLLENAFALVMGGAFFSNKHWLKQGEKLLREELDEQILQDGAHFELSPMYHQIILFRLLELLDWYSNFKNKDLKFEKFLSNKASAMCAWLKNISFSDGTIPHFNDSTDNIAYPTNWLLEYASEIGVLSSDIALSTSGYRSINIGDYQCRVDFGQVGPTYQLGHAHADALSFVLNFKNAPFFVDTGLSTYQIGRVRDKERSTVAHNTVVVNQQNQSKVWSGFRVAERANITINEDLGNFISGMHDGYKKYGIYHNRIFQFNRESIFIQDILTGNNEIKKEFYLHLAEGLDFTIENDIVIFTQNVELRFTGATEIKIEDYEMARGYNNYIKSKKIIVVFKDVLNTEIFFKQ